MIATPAHDKDAQSHTQSSIWIANVAAAAVAGHGTLHHLSSPGLFRQMRVCGWQRQGIYPLSPSLYCLLFKFGSGSFCRCIKVS
ncbi:hypothetical protein Q8A67_023204 [Cirrhinus molitorella]|uniref:Uncharacterized protein n=1 Tax=Cirrhinus molitorella TaxID=172907 RepID=A0AA88P4P1_9TELE|nr:hypothetical protein Q8A67_023204 [Cirrhinus molitorella]